MIKKWLKKRRKIRLAGLEAEYNELNDCRNAGRYISSYYLAELQHTIGRLKFLTKD